MRASLARDLARWERGVLSAADLELRHPGRAVELLAVYERLADLGGALVPDPEAGWERLREQLPEHRVAVPVRTMGPAFSLRRLVARPLALAAALVLVGAAVGYAAAPEAVNRRVASVWENVADFFRDEPSEDRPDRSPGGERPGVAPSVSDDEDGDESGGPGEDGDDREDRDDDREGLSEDSGDDDSGDDDSGDDDSGDDDSGDDDSGDDDSGDDDSGEGPDDDSGEGPDEESGEGPDDDSGEGEEGDE